MADRLSDLAGPQAKIQSVESDDVGPCGMASVKGCHALDIDRGGDLPIVTLQYVYISVQSEFTPTKFWFLFVGLTSWKLTVEGINLRVLYDQINNHCLRRIRKQDRGGFGKDDGKPAVTKLEVVDVTPKDRD